MPFTRGGTTATLGTEPLSFGELVLRPPGELRETSTQGEDVRSKCNLGNYLKYIRGGWSGAEAGERLGWLQEADALGEACEASLLIPPGRHSQLAAYASAHRNWIERYDLPTSAEADFLRLCYGVGDTSTGEWAVIREIISPPDPRPEASYTVIGQAKEWVVIDERGNEITSFKGRIDAWKHVDTLRLNAGIMSQFPFRVVPDDYVPRPRPAKPRTGRGDEHANLVSKRLFGT